MPPNDGAMSGKVCLVTGATSGIGEVTARELARMGATVIAVGRSRERGAAALEQIRAAAGDASVGFMRADLSSQAQVRELAGEFRIKHSRLDVLVNNAGALFAARRESVDGLEMTFALNHLGYFLLTSLLLDTLRASAPSRVVNVSSYGHRGARVDFDDLQATRGYNGLRVYRRSKLANLLFTYELARRLAGTGVTVNAVNPGLVATRFGFNNLGFLPDRAANLLIRLYGFVGTTAEQDARTAIYLATSPAVEGVTGRYFVNEREALSSAASHDREAAERLWRVSAELTELSS